MSEPRLSCADIRGILVAVAFDLGAHLEEVRELDAALGDGDLGVTLELASGVLTKSPDLGSEEDIGVLLAALGRDINKVSPSTFGTLLAAAFLGAAAPVRGQAAVGAADLLAMGEGAVAQIKKRGKAEVGDKTMLDSLVPAVEAFAGALAEDKALPEALSHATEAARAGMEATTSMTAKYGRASWRREESQGIRDGGATALYYLIRSFAEHAVGRLA